MESNKKVDVEAGSKTCHRHRDDMADSFGDAYSTRSSDEGFGVRYEEHVKYGQKATAERDFDTQIRQGYDQSQGSEVSEK